MSKEAMSPTPEHDEGPSLESADCLGQPPATGLRLPPPRGDLGQRVRSEHEAGGERVHGTRGGPSDRLSDARVAALGTGAPAPGPTGLVSEGRLHADPLDPNGVGWTLREGDCPLEGSHSFDRTTGEIVWRPTCKSARCPRCSRQVSAQTFALARRALAGSDVETVPGLPVNRLQSVDRARFITLTRAPEGWQETRAAMWRWLERLRRQGFTMHVLWVVEEGSDTGMKHVHVIQWGDFIPKALLSESWPYGSTQIEAAKAATDYLAKGVLRYVAKELDGDSSSIEGHMNLNGGRAAHWSREFFAGESREGFRKRNPLPGVYFVEVDR